MKKIALTLAVVLSLSGVAAFTQQTTTTTTKKGGITITTQSEPSDPDGPVPTCNPNVQHCAF